ncbi:hypothetical protein [Ramlibacter sp. PS4R-6]|uniref:hypothetical protein n=1 Tax=Ramlibacter sp. PS4R-6 TaxID=3133438 RepID=UPI0030AAD256
MNEIVTGPFRGYYIAAYACPSGGDREEYAPYIKLFDSRPESYFEQIGCVLKARPPLLTNSAERALYLALAHARIMIEGLPPASELDQIKHQSLLEGFRALPTQPVPL